MKLFIPELGTKIKLTEHWTFKLYAEERNFSLFKQKELEDIKKASQKAWQSDFWWKAQLKVHEDWAKIHSLEEGTVLVVDRIYIRKGAKNFSSLSFKIPGQKKRFWVKLNDVNNIECDIIP